MRFLNSLTCLALVASFSFVASIGSAAVIHKNVDYKSDGKTFEGYLAYDDTAKNPEPGLLVAHNWMGVTTETKSKVDQMAALGYVAFALDIYGKGVHPKNADEAGKLAGLYKKDRPLLRKRMQAGLDTLRAQKNVDTKRLVAVGYCFGGTAAIELARSGADLKDVVTFHGGLDSPTPADGKNIKAKMLILHGADDPFVPATDVAAFEDEMRKSGVDWQLVKYGGAVHSFTEKGAGNDNSKGAAYNANADHRSWETFASFLKETL